jgi:hypothetical protein
LRAGGLAPDASIVLLSLTPIVSHPISHPRLIIVKERD